MQLNTIVRCSARIRRSFLPLGGVLVLCGLLAAQQPSQAPQSIPALKKPAPAQGPVDTIIGHVETGKDGWLSELYDEEIKAQLSVVKKHLKHIPLEKEQLAPFIAADFRGTLLTPTKGTHLRDTVPWVEVYQPEREFKVTAKTLPHELGRWLGDYEHIDELELKSTAISIEAPDPPQVQFQIRYYVTGTTPKHEVRQITGYWMTQWRKDADKGWQWLGVVWEEGWESRAPKALFADITTCALPPGPAVEQLQRGIDWWSNNLDVATGIDIYGHNGVAVADYDGDGLEDFYVCQPAGLPNRLFHNMGDGTFEEVARQAGVDVLDRSTMPLFFDYDNDEDPDLLVVGDALLLFRNDGKERFSFIDQARSGLTPATEERGIFTSACTADYDRDGFLDVYVTSYVWQVGETSNRLPVPYHDATNGTPNYLFRNHGDGTFRDVTGEVGLNENNNRFSFACSWADYDNNGWPDLYVANDFGRNNLYRNQGGKFRDVAAEARVEDLGAGMSVAWADYDNDGLLDLYVGNMYSTAGLRTTMQPIFKPGSPGDVKSFFRRQAKGNSLFRNRGDGTFEDVSEKAGVTMGRWAWSSNFIDIDLDGWEDIHVANGYVTNESTKDL
ncbi:MAG: VCBS repeat-containing protein [Acidobacteria bacterium]|nr:VCBS repeat-containing protein [Acidobacteriota bacterium]